MDQSDYITAWLVYIGAAVVMSGLCWRFFRRFLPRELAYLLQCWVVAVLVTPWYVMDGQDIMAPAFIVFALDVVTIAPVAGVRALTPLVMALVAGLLLAVALSVVYRIRRRSEPAEVGVEPVLSCTAIEPELPPHIAEPADSLVAKPPRKTRTSRKEVEERVEPLLFTDESAVAEAVTPAPKITRRKPKSAKPPPL